MPEPASRDGVWRTGNVEDTFVAFGDEAERAVRLNEPPCGDYFREIALPEVSLISSQDFMMTVFTLSGMGT